MNDNDKVKLILEKLNIQYSEVARNMGYTGGTINKILSTSEYKVTGQFKECLVKKYNVRREFIYDGIFPIFTFEFTEILDGIDYYTKTIKNKYSKQDHKTLCELRIKRKSDTRNMFGLYRELTNGN